MIGLYVSVVQIAESLAVTDSEAHPAVTVPALVFARSRTQKPITLF